MNAGRLALREHLLRDAPARELSAARFMTVASGASGVAALVLMPLIGWRLSLSLTALLAMLTIWYGLQVYGLRRGFFSRALSWANVALEVSIPAVIFVVDVRNQGAAYALSAPPLAIWGTLVALSALRGSRPLAVTAGLLAAVEYGALYVTLALPQLDASAPVALGPQMVAIRAAFLFSAGLVAAAFVGHFNRRAEEALAAVRRRDLMGKYLLHERIGAGGMAEVFRATYAPEGGFEKVVAIKRVLPAFAERSDFVDAFRREAALGSRLNHPQIVAVLDFGLFDDTYFLAMEHVDGLGLHRVLAAHPQGLPFEAVVELAVRLSSALEYVHSRRGDDGRPLGLVHRDVNPPNVLLSVHGEVKLTDFGIARVEAQTRLTRAGLIKGKSGYFAPEQLAGEPIDGRADLFALGVTLHEALTGQFLFPTDSETTEARAVFEGRIDPPSTQRADVPAELDAAVMALLAREAAQRPDAATALVTWRGLQRTSGTQALAEAVRVARAYRAAVEEAQKPTVLR